MWPTARTTASRSSTARAAIRASGTTSTGRADSSWTALKTAGRSTWASSATAWPSTRRCRTWAHASPCSTPRARRSRASAGSSPGRSRASSSRRTAWSPTRAATCTSRRCPGPSVASTRRRRGKYGASRSFRAASRVARKVQMRGGDRRPHAKRTLCTLSVRRRAPTKQPGPLSAACHREEAGDGTGEELARLEVFECALDVHVLRRLLDGPAPAQDRALEWRELQVAHGQLAGDMRPARAGESHSRQHFVEIAGHDAAVSARGRAFETSRNHDGREHLAFAPEVAHAEPNVVIGSAAEASTKANAHSGVSELLERGEERLKGLGHGRLVGHAQATGRPKYFRRSGSHAASSRVDLPITLAASSHRLRRIASGLQDCFAARATSSGAMRLPCRVRVCFEPRERES